MLGKKSCWLWSLRLEQLKGLTVFLQSSVPLDKYWLSCLDIIVTPNTPPTRTSIVCITSYCHNPNPNDNTAQPQHCSWVRHENDCANPTTPLPRPPQKLKNIKNTSLAVLGALAHGLQRRSACNNHHLLNPKWPLGSGNRSNFRNTDRSCQYEA